MSSLGKLCCCKKKVDPPDPCDDVITGVCCVNNVLDDPTCLGCCTAFDQSDINIGTICGITTADCSYYVGQIVGYNPDGSDQVVARVEFVPDIACTKQSCGCIVNSTCKDCTDLGGTFHAGLSCIDACGGSCCIEQGGIITNCVDVANECDCRLATSSNQRSIFRKGMSCVNTNCNPCTGQCNLPQVCVVNRVTRSQISGQSGVPTVSQCNYTETATYKQPMFMFDYEIADANANPANHTVRDNPVDSDGNFYHEESHTTYEIIYCASDCVNGGACLYPEIDRVQTCSCEVFEAHDQWRDCDGCVSGATVTTMGKNGQGSPHITWSSCIQNNQCYGPSYKLDNNGNVLYNCPVDSGCQQQIYALFCNQPPCPYVNVTRIRTGFGTTCCGYDGCEQLT